MNMRQALLIGMLGSLLPLSFGAQTVRSEDVLPHLKKRGQSNAPLRGGLKLAQATQVQPEPATEEPKKPTETPPAEEPQATPQLPQAEEIYLNFDNAELTNFVNYIANLKKLNLIPDKTMVGNKISLHIRKPISIAEAWRIFYTVLDKAGFAIVEIGDVYKIVPKDKKKLEPLPSYINVAATDLPDSDMTLRYVAFLENIKVQDVQGLLQSMLDATATIIPQPDVNGLIISDKSYNIKAAMRIIQELDKTGLHETVQVLRLENADATDVAELFKSLIEDKQPTNPLARLLGKKAESKLSYFSASTKVIAEERTNSLILLGTKDSIDKIVLFIKNHIDTSLRREDVDSPLHVFELQYTDAKQMVELLKSVTTNPDSEAGQVAAKHGAIRGGVKYFKPMTFVADAEGNRIIASAPDKRDWKLLKETIRNLDKPQPQVAIESLIITVDNTDLKEMGGQVRNKKHGTLGDNIDFQSVPVPNGKTVTEVSGTDPNTTVISLLGNLLSSLTGGLGKTLLTFGRKQNIWGVFSILRRETHATLLAQPFLSVTNKYEARIVIGQTKRIASQTASGIGFATTGLQDQSANLELEVKPQINIDGIINMKIRVKLDQFTNAAGTERQNREITTNISVADGQVLVLGGLVKTTINEDDSKTPILGDIPVLGWLFKHKVKTITKENVLIFMSPTIIKPRTSQGVEPYTRMKLDLAKEDLKKGTSSDKSVDPVHNWFFNPEQETYAHKIDDFSDARYQPVTVDIKHDPYYRSELEKKKKVDSAKSAKSTEEAEETETTDQAAPLTAMLKKRNSPHLAQRTPQLSERRAS